MEADEPIAQIETDKVFIVAVLSFLATVIDASSVLLIFWCTKQVTIDVTSPVSGTIEKVEYDIEGKLLSSSI